MALAIGGLPFVEAFFKRWIVRLATAASCFSSRSSQCLFHPEAQGQKGLSQTPEGWPNLCHWTVSGSSIRTHPTFRPDQWLARREWPRQLHQRGVHPRPLDWATPAAGPRCCRKRRRGFGRKKEALRSWTRRGRLPNPTSQRLPCEAFAVATREPSSRECLQSEESNWTQGLRNDTKI